MKKFWQVASSGGPLWGLIFVIVLFSILVEDGGFYRVHNIKTILSQSIILGIGALGMLLVIVSAGIDLSVGSIIALSCVGCAKILVSLMAATDPETGEMINRFTEDDWQWYIYPMVAIGFAMLIGAICGLFNGFMTATLKMAPFIITLGTMKIFRGMAKMLAKEQTVAAPDTWLGRISNIPPTPKGIDEAGIFERVAALFHLAPGVWVLLILTVVIAVIMRYTVLGRYLFAIGSNEETAKLCGINVNFYKILTYGLAGLLTGLSGAILFCRLSIGSPTAAVGMELDIIAAVVIGGASLNGGEGSAVGCIIGALLIFSLRNGCSLCGFPSWVIDVVIGSVLILAVAIDRLKHLDENSWLGRRLRSLRSSKVNN